MPDRVDARDPTRTRLPPGQIVTRKWPVLHYGTVPSVDLAAWRFEVTRRGRAAALADLGRARRCRGARPSATSTASPAGAGTTTCSRACRSRPSWRAPVSSRRPRYVLVHAEQDYTTNLPLADLDRPANLLALTPQRRAARARARRPGAAAGAPSLLLEERQVGDGISAARGGLPGILGAERLPHAGRSVAGGALRPARPGADAARSEIGPWRDRGSAPSPFGLRAD